MSGNYMNKTGGTVSTLYFDTGVLKFIGNGTVHYTEKPSYFGIASEPRKKSTDAVTNNTTVDDGVAKSDDIFAASLLGCIGVFFQTLRHETSLFSNFTLVPLMFTGFCLVNSIVMFSLALFKSVVLVRRLGFTGLKNSFSVNVCIHGLIIAVLGALSFATRSVLAVLTSTYEFSALTTTVYKNLIFVYVFAVIIMKTKPRVLSLIYLGAMSLLGASLLLYVKTKNPYYHPKLLLVFELMHALGVQSEFAYTLFFKHLPLTPDAQFIITQLSGSITSLILMFTFKKEPLNTLNSSSLTLIIYGLCRALEEYLFFFIYKGFKLRYKGLVTFAKHALIVASRFQALNPFLICVTLGILFNVAGFIDSTITERKLKSFNITSRFIKNFAASK